MTTLERGASRPSAWAVHPKQFDGVGKWHASMARQCRSWGQHRPATWPGNGPGVRAKERGRARRGRNEESLRAVASEIGGHFALCDITSRAEVRALADTAVAKLGRVDAFLPRYPIGRLNSAHDVINAAVPVISPTASGC